MFAFVISDENHICAARDPIGIKPFYVGERDDAWCFASEQKALVDIANRVREFPPGTFFHSATGYQPFYRVPDASAAEEAGDAEQATRELRQTLEEAIGKRLLSDVPLGAFPSAGLDSSIICAIARRPMHRLHTFSVGFRGSAGLEAARCVARHLDTIHHEYVLREQEVLEKLPAISFHLEFYDQDLVRSAIPTYFTARLAAEEVKVVLTGEGADELFAGYRYHRGIGDASVLRNELRRSLCSLHNINLQRVDRLTMAHSIEARVPFLDINMIALAERMPVAWKLYRPSKQVAVEKWILRKSCADLLPAEIVWRGKAQFDEGSGTADVLDQQRLEKCLGPTAWRQYATEHDRGPLRSHEECVYHKMLSDAYRGAEFVMRNVAHWSDRYPDA